MIRLLLIAFLGFFSQLSFAQRVIEGKVTAGSSAEGLPGVNVLIKGTAVGTATDVDGHYTIAIPDDNTILVFSFIGYETIERPVGSLTTLDVNLATNAQALNEVVVIGYGEKDKRDLTGALSNIGDETIKKSVSLTPEMAMQGRMAGVFVGTNGGNPNARPVIRIRGVSTLNDASPLYVVDGVPIMEFGTGYGNNTAEQDLRGNQNILSLINPGDIASISVLKDASAAAIYGSRAANGVVLITTKRGQRGAPRIEFNASRGVQNIPDTYNVLNTQEYTALYTEMFDNDYLYRTQQAPNANPAAPYIWDNSSYAFFNLFNPASSNANYPYRGNDPTYHWQKPLLNKNAAIEDYSIRISGGSDASTYYLGAGYSRTESPLINNYNERYSVSSNLTAKVSNLFEIGLLARITYMEAQDNTLGNLSQHARITPWQPIYDADDPLDYAPAIYLEFAPNPDYDINLSNPGYAQIITSELLPYGKGTAYNNFALMSLGDNTYTLLKNFGNAYLQLTPIDGLRIKASLGIDYTLNTRNRPSNNIDGVRFQAQATNPYGADGTMVGSSSERITKNINMVSDMTVNYTRALGDHHFDLLLNASSQRFTYNYVSIFSPRKSNDLPYDVIGRGIDSRWTNGDEALDKKALQGYVGRLSYQYQDRYYLDVSVRHDGSSEFSPSHRWGTFPAVSGAWRLSAEDFFKQAVPMFDDLKLRAGYGTIGNSFATGIGFSSFAYLSVPGFTADYALGSTEGGNGRGTDYQGAFIRRIPNKKLTWEKSKTFNIGFDGALLDHQLTFTLEYYNKLTDGIIQEAGLPLNAGYPAILQNIAAVRNAGIEVQLGYSRRVGNVTLAFSGNLTTVKNRVEKLFTGNAVYTSDPLTSATDDEYVSEKGHSLGEIYGYVAGGIYQSAAEITADTTAQKDLSGANPQPGDMWFKNLNGDHVVNADDQTRIGKTVPGYYYGFSVSAQYKHFDLAISFQGIGDVKKINFARWYGESMSSDGNNFWTSVKNRWTPETPSNTMPRAVYGDPHDNARLSTRWVENAAFMRLKTMQLGYTMPADLLAATKTLTSLRVYASATNLFTFTPWTGLDPENDLVPPARVFSIGINASF